MPDASVICVKPRTLTRIIPFENLKQYKNFDTAKVTLLGSMTSLNIRFLLREVEEVFERDPSSFKNSHSEGSYIDGILQDRATGELFYFLALEKKGKIDINKIDEGSIIEYEREYKGIAEINLYKGNTGHADAQVELLKNFVKHGQSDEAEKENIENIIESIESINQTNIEVNEKADKVNQLMSQLRPVLVKGELVRYVDVLSA